MKSEDEAGRLARTHHHELRNASTASGILVGATLGVFGGPVGLATGGVLGGALGGLVGVVLEREVARAEAHERELDETVGVTSDALGAHEVAASALDRREHRRRERTSELLLLDDELEGRESARPAPAHRAG